LSAAVTCMLSLCYSSS